MLDPVTNKAATGNTVTTQGTATLSVSLSAYPNQVFSALLFQNGVLKAAIPDSGTGTTNGAGSASVSFQSVSTSNCATGVAATLPNGTYDLYFAINYNGQTRSAIAGGSCGANGFIYYSNGGNIFGQRSSVTINGNTTVSITSATGAVSKAFQFIIATSQTWNYECYLTELLNYSFSTNVQPFALFSRSNDGNMSGVGANINLLPVGSYRYFCYADTNLNANFFQAGIDRVASGTLFVNSSGTGTLTLPQMNFVLQ